MMEGPRILLIVFIGLNIVMSMTCIATLPLNIYQLRVFVYLTFTGDTYVDSISKQSDPICVKRTASSMTQQCDGGPYNADMTAVH